MAFIQKTNEVDIVDGGFLDSAFNWDLYVFTGVYLYTNVVGTTKTVYSFKKFTTDVTEQKKDMKTYGIFKEFLIDNALWDFLEGAREYAFPIRYFESWLLSGYVAITFTQRIKSGASLSSDKSS